MTSPRRGAVALRVLAEEIVECRACPRLVRWREEVARTKRRAYRDETYWGRPVPGFGDPSASLVLVGLAPGAHGANRTGRMFTGDRSGDFLYAALHRAELASQAESRSREDGLSLRGVFITAPLRCVPPENKPTAGELGRCRPFFAREIALLPSARVYLGLGAIAYAAVLELAGVSGPPFRHGAQIEIPNPRAPESPALLFTSYHVSQQNTQTGRLTPAMFDEVLGRAAHAAGLR